MSYKSHDHRLFYPKTGNIIFQRIWFFISNAVHLNLTDLSEVKT